MVLSSDHHTVELYDEEDPRVVTVRPGQDPGEVFAKNKAKLDLVEPIHLIIVVKQG